MTPPDPQHGLAIHKMHGLGNDFVVIDRRGGGSDVTPALARALADRHRGVGFDQLAVIEPGMDADAHLVFLNADGSGSDTCGNATRCVARHLMDESGRTELTLTTARGRLAAADAGGRLTRVNMGPPFTAWQDIPLAEAADTLELPIKGAPVATGMGNPHCTFFVDDAEDFPLAQFGPHHEHDPLFPEATNVEIAAIAGPDAIRLRVWERGAGITLASGSGAAAAAVAAARRGLTGRRVRVELDGGALDVDWRDDGVWVTGPTAHVFDARLTPAFLATLR